ncbi:type III-A CRISPR-associated CARF protein Csm6 [Anaerostipes butyraticus]|uniref:CRISPR-associated protein Csm6 n=1 Tax=Anaerostipes butyraticus TaxID=645466 RepID=A0A916Q6K6_9FIRM|nr:CRISPR-associated protein Csm6 [Anaerostipes butyraticus]GFO85363.1 CRISPR-associated protein Csm6 [Anaerostipes butyraticus]HJC81813.1 CRISPR-associated protein Csm6 [Candidatus Anaerostipes avicola]
MGRKKLLFSPVGGTDPISNFRDGALLHICRVYQPDIVYLYLSKEMCEAQEKDDRYRFCLRKLGEKLDHTFQIITIEKPELEDVQIFDAFILEYRELLKELQKQYPDCEILLNVSSGTPAMKSALQILAATGETKMQPIQVSTPQKGINPRLEDRENYDVDTYWELNEDNEDGFENRCMESKNFYLVDEIRKETIIKQIRAYDYVAALTIAEEMTAPLSEEILAMLRAASCRLKLNIHGIDQELKPYGIQFLPIRDDNVRGIFEYVLNLEIKVKKEEYADFIRAITPVVLELFKIALKEYGGIDWKQFCYKTKDGSWKWDINKLKQNASVWEALNTGYKDGFSKPEIYAIHLLKIMRSCVKNPTMLQLSEEIRKIEANVRNMTAHNLVSVTDVWVKRRCGYTPVEIFELLKQYVKKLHFKIADEDWNSYDVMNQMIIEKIQG